MIGLKWIDITDFRIHKKIRIDFDQQVTSIVGNSYTGKSTVIRALRFVLFNKPSGTAMIRWGQKKTSVTVCINGHTIRRIRGKTKNLYILDGQRLEGFGSGVPEPIENIVNMSLLNFQGQHDVPFWFGMSSGGVSRELNHIVDLTIIDKTLTNLSKEVRKSKTSVQVSNDRLKEIQEHKKDLQHVPTMEEEFDPIVQLKKEVDQTESKIDTILSIKEELQKTQKILDGQMSLPKIGIEGIEKLEQMAEKINGMSSKIEDLLGMRRSLKCRVDGKAISQTIIERLEAKLEKIKRCPLCGKTTTSNLVI